MKGDGSPHLRAGRYVAAICRANVSERIDAHKLGLIPFIYPYTSWSGDKEGVDSCVSTYRRSGCQGGTGLLT